MSKKEEKAKDRLDEDRVETESDQNGAVEDIELIGRDLEKAREEAAEYLDSLQRLKAEFENFRKRMIREQSQYLEMAAETLIIQLIPVLDNFERALNHKEGAGTEDYHAGIELLYNQLTDLLGKQGLRPIDPVGEVFDPLRHEALMQVESEEHGENEVVEVLDKGYELKGKVIRPAKVKVAK